MRTGWNIWRISSFLVVLALFSCNSTTIEQDMEEWCGCEKDVNFDGSKKKECDDLMTEISRKYAFDPNAAEIVKTKVAECGK